MGIHIEDLRGETFGSLKVQELVEGGKRTRWLCKCRCGNTRIVDARRLKSGEITACRSCVNKKVPDLGISVPKMRVNTVAMSIIRGGDEPYQNLANAIITVAADDYREALRSNDKNLKVSVKRFFSSDWYKMLTDVSADVILNMLDKEYENELRVVAK